MVEMPAMQCSELTYNLTKKTKLLDGIQETYFGNIPETSDNDAK